MLNISSFNSLVYIQHTFGGTRRKILKTLQQHLLQPHCEHCRTKSHILDPGITFR
uniref:Uncharacterized protein n=1 Tax=Arundo donax TaxID=35708 RepID=A0A0A9ALC3_ARUDO